MRVPAVLIESLTRHADDASIFDRRPRSAWVRRRVPHVLDDLATGGSRSGDGRSDVSIFQAPASASCAMVQPRAQRAGERSDLLSLTDRECFRPPFVALEPGARIGRNAIVVLPLRAPTPGLQIVTPRPMSRYRRVYSLSTPHGETDCIADAPSQVGQMVALRDLPAAMISAALHSEVPHMPFPCESCHFSPNRSSTGVSDPDGDRDEVDVVSSCRTHERRIDGLHEVFRLSVFFSSGPSFSPRRTWSKRHTTRAAAEFLEHVAHDDLGLALGVHLGVVEKIDARIVRCSHAFARRVIAELRAVGYP